MAGRLRGRKEAATGPGPVIYWMQRDQRAADNWALLHAQDQALDLGRPLGVVFCLVPEFLGAARRQFAFMLAGLRETAARLAEQNIPFLLCEGDPAREIPAVLAGLEAARLVIDFNPLRPVAGWQTDVVEAVTCPVDQVDAHNVVPAWVVSDKQEYAARTIRPKLQRLLPRYLEEFPPLRAHPHTWPADVAPVDWARRLDALAQAAHGPRPDWIEPGARAAARVLARFVGHRLAHYDDGRNDPTLDLQSDLSPYLHFGQLAPQRAALAAAAWSGNASARDAFLEELVVRRELSDNFCLFNPDYDSFAGFPDWAQRTLEQHADDPREHLYGLDELESGATHDPLWNAAQGEMKVRGKMHGYLRMYWAKKILEWSRDPAEALQAAIALNDRYELDGRDPNGYVGCAWSIGGVHDRPWQERPVFGKIRYMSQAGCRRKFRVDRYIDRIARQAREAGA